MHRYRRHYHSVRNVKVRRSGSRRIQIYTCRALRVVSYYRLDGMCILMCKLWYDKNPVRVPNLHFSFHRSRGYQSSSKEIGSLDWPSHPEDINSLTEAHKVPWVKVCVQTRVQRKTCTPCHFRTAAKHSRSIAAVPV